MTRDNPAMTFFPLQRQLMGGERVNDHEALDMQIEARRMHREIARLRDALEGIRGTADRNEHPAIWHMANTALNPDRAAPNALGNIAHAMQEDEG